MRDIKPVRRRNKSKVRRIQKIHNDSHTLSKSLITAVSIFALVIQLAFPMGAFADDIETDLITGGQTVFTKYDCPADLTFDASTAKPNASGVATIPEGCLPAEGYQFGIILEPGKTDESGPFLGVDDATPFITIPAVTDALGQITVLDFPVGGRINVVELDASANVVADSNLYGFLCSDETSNSPVNYGLIFNALEKNTYCNIYNKAEGEIIVPPTTSATIKAHKVVCDSESYLPNWGNGGVPTQPEPPVITATTAADYVAASSGKCHLQSGWKFQYGFAEKDNTSGVHKLPSDFVGEADGTSTLGQCEPTYCGNNTFTGTDYHDWKTFDTSTSASGATPAEASISDLEGAPGIWVREVQKDGYIPFSYPPIAPPGGFVSAEMFCHNDIQNFDNYDQVMNPVLGETYHCVAFNALKSTDTTIKAYKVVCDSESDLPNWGVDGVTGKPTMITATTAANFVAASNGQCHLEEDWKFQYGFAEKDNTSGVHKLPGSFVGEADGTTTLGQCNPTFCGNNTDTGTDYQDWKTFDSETSAGGTIPAEASVSDLEGAPGIWVREVLKDGYIPFSYPPVGPPGNDVSAEMYCHTDIINYDNYDQIFNPQSSETYYCVAFNVLKDRGGNGGTNVTDPGIVKTADDSTPAPGQTLIYTLTVNENSGTNATNVTVTDILPAHLTYVSDDAAVDAHTTYDSGSKTLTWNIPSLSAGGSVVIKITVTVSENILSGTISNTATITAGADQGNSNPNNDSSTSTVTVTPPCIDCGSGGGTGPFTLTVNTIGSGEGVVTSNDGFINCNSKSATLINCSHTYPAGTAVTLTATPNSGSTFDNWHNACTGSNPVCNLTMNSNLNTSAQFNIPTTGGGGGGGGTSTGGGGGGGSGGLVTPPITNPGGSVLGDNTGPGGGTNPPPGNILGAELPRTGLPENFMNLFLLMLAAITILTVRYEFKANAKAKAK